MGLDLIGLIRDLRSDIKSLISELRKLNNHISELSRLNQLLEELIQFQKQLLAGLELTSKPKE